MKRVLLVILASAISTIVVQAQNGEQDKPVSAKASETWEKTKEKTKEAGHAVAQTARKATNAVAEALTPDPDAHKVEVNVSDEGLDLPKKLRAGKTAFVVKNVGKSKHNFEVTGRGIDRKFLLALAPEETKVLHVDLEPGTYEASVLMKDHQEKRIAVNLTVR